MLDGNLVIGIQLEDFIKRRFGKISLAVLGIGIPQAVECSYVGRIRFEDDGIDVDCFLPVMGKCGGDSSFGSSAVGHKSMRRSVAGLVEKSQATNYNTIST